MARQRLRGVVLMLAALGLAELGCVSKPVLEVHSAWLRSATPDGVGLDLYLKVNNENVFDVQVRDVRAQVTIAERFRLPDLRFSPNQWLAAGRSTLVRVPMTVPWPMIPQLLAVTVGSDKIDYRVRGAADVTAVRALGIERNDYPVDEEGSLSRVDLVRVAQRSLPF
jgi:hypothetical protein